MYNQVIYEGRDLFGNFLRNLNQPLKINKPTDYLFFLILLKKYILNRDILTEDRIKFLLAKLKMLTFLNVKESKKDYVTLRKYLKLINQIIKDLTVFKINVDDLNIDELSNIEYLHYCHVKLLITREEGESKSRIFKMIPIKDLNEIKNHLTFDPINKHYIILKHKELN